MLASIPAAQSGEGLNQEPGSCPLGTLSVGPEGKVNRGGGRIKAWGSAAFDLPPPPPALGPKSSGKFLGQLHPGLNPRDGDPGEGAVGTQLCPTSCTSPCPQVFCDFTLDSQPSQLSCVQV